MKDAEFVGLAAFMAVFEECNFRRAAKRLQTSPSAISRTVMALEERMGARLLNRTTRSVAPTEAGRELYDRIQPALATVEEAMRDTGAHQKQPRGAIRINLPRIAAWQVVLPVFSAFTRAYPAVRLDLVIDDNVTDIVGEGFDAGVRSGQLVQQDMVAIRLTPDLKMMVVGSPGYFADRARPRLPADLCEHACITYRWNRTGALDRWRFNGPEGPVDVDVPHVMTVNDTNVILDVALRGAGLAMLPEIFVRSRIERRELVQVLDGWCRSVPAFHAYFPARARIPAALRAFIDFIKLPAGTAEGRNHYP